MDLSFNLAPSNRDLKDPTSRQKFDDTVEQKRVIDLRACRIHVENKYASCIEFRNEDEESLWKSGLLLAFRPFRSNWTSKLKAAAARGKLYLKSPLPHRNPKAHV